MRISRKYNFIADFRFEDLIRSVETCVGRGPGLDIPEELRRLARVYEKRGWHDEAEELYKEATTGNYDADHLYEIGRMYYDGDCYKENDAKGCALFEIAYDRGCRKLRVGDYIMMGSYRQYDVKAGIRYGLTRSMPLAVKWFNKVVEMDKFGYALLGKAYMEREIRDFRKAVSYFMKADENTPSVYYFMGVILEFGLCEIRDLSKAEECFRKVQQLYDDGKDTLGAYLEDVEYRIAELHASEKEMDFSPEYFEWLWDNGLI